MTRPLDKPIWLRGALNSGALTLLETFFESTSRPGSRLRLDSVLRAALAPIDAEIQTIVPKMNPVRALAFNKTAQTNWALPWHQDRVIAVKNRCALPEFGNWTQKDGEWHCEPPAQILDKMLFVRVHIDDGDAESGAMEIAVGSHKAGLVAANQAASTAMTYPHDTCTAARGDILILPMLTLHRSLAAPKPGARRVFRIDYAADRLPEPLEWAN